MASSLTILSIATVLAILLSEYTALLLSESLSNQDKISTLSRRFEQTLFVPKNSQEVYKMREVFFPSSEYRYWQADNIQIIDAQVCLNIQTASPNYSCWSERGKQDSIIKTHTNCLVFRWTNSYFVNLIDIHQLYCFDPVTTGILFGTVAHGHGARLLQLSLNVTCDELLSSMDKTMIERALVQFLSWSKSYVKLQKRVGNLDEADQGYVTRKYDYVTVNYLLFDDQSQLVYYVTLTCFILCNILTAFLMCKHAPTIHRKLSEATNHSGFRKSIIKGLTVLVAVVVVPLYIFGISGVHTNSNILTKPCDHTSLIQYYCIPEDEYPRVHQKQLMSLTTKCSILLTATLLYVIASIYTIRTTTSGILFQKHYFKFVEVYLLWALLMSIQIGIGLASLPLIIFTILIPMYMIFYISVWTIGLSLLLLPFVALFHLCQYVQKRKMFLWRILEFILVYSLASGIIIALLGLYYLFLSGGASMKGVKGVLFSLLPPMLISVVVLMLKRRLSNRRKLGTDSIEEEPLICSQIQKTHHLIC